MNKKMKHLDLFSGIGGFALAAKWASFETIAFCEKDEFCQKVLIKHWPDVYCYPYIEQLSWKSPVYLLTASLPCQPFSIAGKQKGKEDERYLWPDTSRIISESKPRWVVLENVPGIVNHLDPILWDLETKGYTWWAYLIAASSIGAPHKRERLWIIAHADSERRINGIDNWEERYFQENFNRDMEKIQSEWSQFIPESWESFEARDWFSFNSRASRKNDGLLTRLDKDRIKALGNAIVPQLIYPILKLINEISQKSY